MARTKNAVPTSVLDGIIALPEGPARDTAITTLHPMFKLTAEKLLERVNKYVADTAAERARNALLSTLPANAFVVDMVTGRLSGEVSAALKGDTSLRFVLTTRWDDETKAFVMAPTLQAARGRKAADSGEEDSEEEDSDETPAKASKRKK